MAAARFRARPAPTDHPIVDAGMGKLWHNGRVHDRARMTAASFLVKHLVIRWREGAAWFMDTLVDANLARAGRRQTAGRAAP